MANEARKNPTPNSISVGDGLVLKGLVVAAEVQDKSWDNKHYKQLKATITDGRRSYFYTQNDDRGQIPNVELFQRAEVRVQSTRTENGNVFVTGQFFQSMAEELVK